MTSTHLEGAEIQKHTKTSGDFGWLGLLFVLKAACQHFMVH